MKCGAGERLPGGIRVTGQAVVSAIIVTMHAAILGETLLNQFRVEEHIAAGGMASIYRVWDLKRSVPLAMKVLHPDLAADPAFIERFRREAHSLEMLIHPHIVPFYGLYQAGELTFLLEGYVDGPSLDQVLRGRGGQPVALREALVYFKALYTSLGFAHAQGIIHCDVKPANVLIDQGGRVILTDFGIARFMDASPNSTSGIGTPLYMAPEQVRGERVTPRTDLYSLGVLMFELLTGQRPFQGDVGVPAEVGEDIAERVRYQQLSLPPPDPRAINAALPAGVSRVILTALEKDPARRYPSAAAMADDLARAVAARFSSLPDRVTLPGQPNNDEPGPVAEQPSPAAGRAETGGEPDAGGADALAGGAPENWSWSVQGDWQDSALSNEGAPFDEGLLLEGGSAADGSTLRQPAVGWDDETAPVQGALPGEQSASDTWPSGPGDQADEPEFAARPAIPASRARRWVWLALLVLLLAAFAGAGALLARAYAAWAALPSPQATSAAEVALATSTPPAASAATQIGTAAPAATLDEPAAATVEPGAAAPDPGLSSFALVGQVVVVARHEGAPRLYLADAESGRLADLPGVPDVNQEDASAPQFSPDGSMLVWTARYNNRAHVVAMDMAEGEPYQLPAGEDYARVSAAAFLPDGARISFWAATAAGSALVIADARSGALLEEIALPEYRNLFVWNPRGDLLAFATQNGSKYEVFTSSTPGAETVGAIALDGSAYAPAWSNDGEWLAFQSDQGRAAGLTEIWVARKDGSAARAVTSTPAESWARAPSWSPDGRYIAFVSDRSGSSGADYGELFVVDLQTGLTRQVTQSGGQIYDWRPAWRPGS